MSDPFLINLAAKMIATAVVVVSASLVVERMGPFLGAMVATLPISAGPAYIFLAMEHGSDFLEKSSTVSLAMNAATAVFIVVYAFLAQRRGVAVSLASALIVWFSVAWMLSKTHWGFQEAIALNVVSFSACILAARKLFKERPPKSKAHEARWWDVPLRVLGVMGLVGVVVLVGRFLGPMAAGIAATVPIVMTSLALILQPRMGGPATALVLANGLPGMIGMGLALIVLHASVSAMGAALALSLAFTVCVSWNAGLIGLRRRTA